MNRSPNERAYPRVPIGYRVRVVTKDQMIGFGVALNVSMGGILLKGDPPLKVGSEVGVAIFLADPERGNRIVTRGTVVRCDSRGSAIQFSTDMEEAHTRALAQLVAAHSPQAAAGA